MTAALLAPGPSLVQTFDPDFAGLRVAVNAAAIRYPCDIWAALDYPMVRDHHELVIGNPRWLTRQQTLADTGQRTRFRDVVVIESLACPVPSWNLKTTICALVLLTGMGVSEVKVYGADWKPDAPDFDGKQRGEDRSAERFEAERVIWDGVVVWMAGSGISVERINQSAVPG